MNVGDVVTVVKKGMVISSGKDTRTIVRFSDDLGVVAIKESELLENSSVIREMLAYARYGIAWRRLGPDGDWLCPRCATTGLSQEQATLGAICSACKTTTVYQMVKAEERDRVLGEVWSVLIDAGLGAARVTALMREISESVT
jgi:hypothetical protein